MRNKRFMPNLLLAALLILFLTGNAFAAQEMLKTNKVKVGEKVLLTETLSKANEEGKIIVLVLLSNPMSCEKCDSLLTMLEREDERYKTDAVFLTAGGVDMLGAASEETLTLKRQYGFVTMGAPWTFFIDKEGVLRKIVIGKFSKEELEETLNGIMERKK